jgi:hypothetical protein
MTAAYPDNFFIIHHRFTGAPFPPEGIWGDVGDGPIEDEEDVIELIIEAWKEEQHEPDNTDFRVWYIAGRLGVAEDCTAWALKTMIETLEERLGE